MKIKTIDVCAKEWWDKVNGNSYFSGRITTNFGMKDKETLFMPFQYGYYNQYEWKAMKMLVEKYHKRFEGYEKSPLWRFCQEKGIILRTSIDKNCKKHEVVEFGVK